MRTLKIRKIENDPPTLYLDECLELSFRDVPGLYVKIDGGETWFNNSRLFSGHAICLGTGFNWEIVESEGVHYLVAVKQ